MIKVGLVGIPGAGKSHLAAALAERFDLAVVDEYAEWVTEHYDWVLNKYASYAGNLAVALERHAREGAVRESFVTCGTMLDTVAYQAAEQMDIDDEFDWRRQCGTLMVLGAMAEDMFSYDFVIYMPTNTDDRYLSSVQGGLEESIEMFITPDMAPVLIADMPCEQIAAWAIAEIEGGMREMNEVPAAE